MTTSFLGQLIFLVCGFFSGNPFTGPIFLFSLYKSTFPSSNIICDNASLTFSILSKYSAVAERCSVRRGSGSGGRCGSSGSGRTLQRAAGQRHWRQWINTIKMGRRRTLQRAAGQRQQWKRLSHLLLQQQQWQNAAACSGAWQRRQCHTTIKRPR
jgi:hypothetical protein